MSSEFAGVKAPNTIKLGEEAVGTYAFDLDTSFSKLYLDTKLTGLELLKDKTFTLQRDSSDGNFEVDITGDGNLRTVGDMTLSGENTFKGRIEITGGTLTMGSDSALGRRLGKDHSEVSVAEGATLKMGGHGSTVYLSGKGTVDVDNGHLSLRTAGKDQKTYENKLTGNGKISLSDYYSFSNTSIAFTNTENDFSGEFDLWQAHVRLDGNTKKTFEKAGLISLAGAYATTTSLIITENTTLKDVQTGSNGGTLTFEFGDKSLGSKDAPMLTVNTLTFNNASNVEVNQGQLNSSMNWLKIDDKGEGQTLIQGKIKGHDYATVKFNDEVVNGGEVVAQKVLNDSGTEVAEASFKIGLVKNSSEIGLNKELKSLKLVDADGDGLLIKPSADAEKDSDFTLSTQLTGNGNVTFDAGGKKVIVQSSIAKPNNYSGKTFVKNGTVETNGNDAFGSTSELNLKSTGKVALGNQLYVSGLVSEKDSVVYLNGHDLTIGYASDSKVDGTLSGAGNIKLYNSFITLSNANTDLSANVKMEGSTIVLNDLDGLGTGVVNAETQSSLTLAADGVFDNKLKGKIDLRVGDGTASTPVPIDVRLTGDNTKLNGKVLMNAGSTLRVTSIEQNLGSSAIETTGGKLYVDEASEEIANIITGSGELHLAAKGMESSFKNGGVDNFEGKVYAESVKLKASGTEKQFAQADVTFGNGAQYKAD